MTSIYHHKSFFFDKFFIIFGNLTWILYIKIKLLCTLYLLSTFFLLNNIPLPDPPRKKAL